MLNFYLISWKRIDKNLNNLPHHFSSPPSSYFLLYFHIYNLCFAYLFAFDPHHPLNYHVAWNAQHRAFLYTFTHQRWRHCDRSLIQHHRLCVLRVGGAKAIMSITTSTLYPSKIPQMRALAKKYNINIKERYKIAFSSVHKAIFICRRELEHVIAFPWMLRACCIVCICHHGYVEYGWIRCARSQ